MKFFTPAQNIDQEFDIPEDAAVATFAGGCFWCMEPSFEALGGVYEAVVGYAGGEANDASYRLVATGTTQHREALQVYYDPTKVTYEQLLEIFWRQIDPTDKGGQFADRGPQYATAIYYHNGEEREKAEKSKEEFAASGKWKAPIVTEIVPFVSFFPAEEEHQNFYKKRSAYYKSYKKGSGREDYLEEKWGDD